MNNATKISLTVVCILITALCFVFTLSSQSDRSRKLREREAFEQRMRERSRLYPEGWKP